MAGSHERAVRADLLRLHPEDRKGGLAATALSLAKRLDLGDASHRDFAALSARLESVLGTLAKMQEPAAVLDPVDELARRRARRLGSDAAAGS